MNIELMFLPCTYISINKYAAKKKKKKCSITFVNAPHSTVNIHHSSKYYTAKISSLNSANKYVGLQTY